MTHETIRQSRQQFGLDHARRLLHRPHGDTWQLDEPFVTIRGQRQYLWRAVNEDGNVSDIVVQSRRNRRAAARSFRTLLKTQGREPRRLITDKLSGYRAQWQPIRLWGTTGEFV